MDAMAETKLEFPEEYTLEQSNQKITKKIAKLSQKGMEQITAFIGHSVTESMFYLYLFKRYKSPCFLIETSGHYWELLGMNLNIKEVYSAEETAQINSYLERLARKLVECINNDVNIIIIPLTESITYPNGKTSGHANVLIYRKQFNHIEHFEPYGKLSSLGYTKLNRTIELFMQLFVECVNLELFKDKTPAQAKDITPLELIDANRVCPYLKGFQTYEEGSELKLNLELEPTGYCSAWSMFFTELCLKNPGMTSSQIITSVFNAFNNKISIKDYFRHIIRGYARFINEKISTYFHFLLSDAKINMEKIKKLNIHENALMKQKMKIIINIEMLSATNPNAIDDRLTFLKHKHLRDLEQNLTRTREFINNQLEINVLKKYKMRFLNFNSPMNTPPTPQPMSTPPLKPVSLPNNPPENACPPGKELNPKTKRCVKVKAAKTVRQIIHDKKDALVQELQNKIKECPPGKVLNPLTGRCIKIPVDKAASARKTIKKTTDPVPKECPPGKELNPKTGRCIAVKTRKNKLLKI